MTIGEAAAATGISAKMLRYYESIGLIPAAGRSGNGYRRYGEEELRTLRFIRRARELGLPVARIRRLVGLWRDPGRASGEVKALALSHVAELRAATARMTAMADALERLAEACQGDARPECPILQDLAAGTVTLTAPGAGATLQ
jgi:MerR family copper efflux transcriptional regulator